MAKMRQRRPCIDSVVEICQISSFIEGLDTLECSSTTSFAARTVTQPLTSSMITCTQQSTDLFLCEDKRRESDRNLPGSIQGGMSGRLSKLNMHSVACVTISGYRAAAAAGFVTHFIGRSTESMTRAATSFAHSNSISQKPRTVQSFVTLQAGTLDMNGGASLPRDTQLRLFSRP